MYRDSHGIRPKLVTRILAGLFHPHYDYNRSVCDNVGNPVMIYECLESVKWQLLTIDDERNVTVPSCVKNIPMQYFTIRDDGNIIKSPVWVSMDWSVLDKFI